MSSDVGERRLRRGVHGLWRCGERIESPRGEVGPNRIDGVHRCGWNARTERGIDHQRDDVAFGPELDDTRLERVRTYVARNGEERVRKVDDDARNGDLGCDAALIGVRTDDECLLRFARGAKNAETRRVGVLEDDIGVATNLGERLLASRAHVIPVADVRGQNCNLRVYSLGAPAERQEALADGRQLRSTDDA